MSLVLTTFGSRSQKFDFVHQTLSYQEARVWVGHETKLWRIGCSHVVELFSQKELDNSIIYLKQKRVLEEEGEYSFGVFN